MNKIQLADIFYHQRVSAELLELKIGGRYNSATFLHMQQEIVNLFCLECDLARAFVHVDHKESPSSCLLLSQFPNFVDDYYLIQFCYQQTQLVARQAIYNLSWKSFPQVSFASCLKVNNCVTFKPGSKKGLITRPCQKAGLLLLLIFEHHAISIGTN